jgi:hypothetical protein
LSPLDLSLQKNNLKLMSITNNSIFSQRLDMTKTQNLQRAALLPQVLSPVKAKQLANTL